ncbi:saccharopine dehydrogenase NADP-binding domain-containing protein [Pseudomonas putida]|nr:saccharopine dehydrogenase NADP-binding domain-containing protein [Pseudomonas putida]
MKVLIVGAGGNFGSIISRKLSQIPEIELVLVGRSEQAKDLAKELGAEYWQGDALADGFAQVLAQYAVELVVHAAGPFQNQSLNVASACIDYGCHYCDLSDAREFVTKSKALDSSAREKGVAILSGCSSVPTLSCAVIDAYLASEPKGTVLTSIRHGITSSGKMPGLSTVVGVLEYAGRSIPQQRNGALHQVPGWKDLEAVKVAGISGRRLVANVDVPDMDIFPERYAVKDIVFKAGPGVAMGALANYALATVVQWGLAKSTFRVAGWLHKLGRRFEFLGDGKSAMYVELKSLLRSEETTYRWEILATHDKGPQIPCCGAIALARKMASGYRPDSGARPCVGEITLGEYLYEIDPSFVTITESKS